MHTGAAGGVDSASLCLVTQQGQDLVRPDSSVVEQQLAGVC